MNKAEFIELHAECVTAMRGYFVEADITTRMLAKCTAEPLPFAERMSLISQELTETNAQTRYAMQNAFSTMRGDSDTGF